MSYVGDGASEHGCGVANVWMGRARRRGSTGERYQAELHRTMEEWNEDGDASDVEWRNECSRWECSI